MGEQHRGAGLETNQGPGHDGVDVGGRRPCGQTPPNRRRSAKDGCTPRRGACVGCAIPSDVGADIPPPYRQ
eukprot:3715864-Alexandrium_andersonii.AAC.1